MTKIKEFKTAYIEEVIIRGLPGSTVTEVVLEVFEWFFNTNNEVDKVTIPGVNGVKVTFERSEPK